MSDDTSESPSDDADGGAGEDYTLAEVQSELQGGANTVAWGGEGAGRGKHAQIYLGVLDAQGQLGGFYIKPQVTTKPAGAWDDIVHLVEVDGEAVPWRFTVVDSPPAQCALTR